jgi:hypothetical protein
MERVLKPREQESDFAPASDRRGLSLMAVSPSTAARPPVLLLLLPSIAVDKVLDFEGHKLDFQALVSWYRVKDQRYFGSQVRFPGIGVVV